MTAPLARLLDANGPTRPRQGRKSTFQRSLQTHPRRLIQPRSCRRQTTARSHKIENRHPKSDRLLARARPGRTRPRPRPRPGAPAVICLPVMAGLVPAIHGSPSRLTDGDARIPGTSPGRSGHDGGRPVCPCVVAGQDTGRDRGAAHLCCSSGAPAGRRDRICRAFHLLKQRVTRNWVRFVISAISSSLPWPRAPCDGSRSSLSRNSRALPPALVRPDTHHRRGPRACSASSKGSPCAGLRRTPRTR